MTTTSDGGNIDGNNGVFVVETMGMPGAGKSTLVASLARRMPQVATVASLTARSRLAPTELLARVPLLRGWRRVVRGGQLREVADFITQNPDFAAVTLEIAGGIDDPVERRWSLEWAFRDWADRQFATSNAPHGAVTLLEEGSCHRLAGLLARQGGSNPSTGAYIKSLPRVDALVVLTLPVEVAFGRLRDKGRRGWTGEFESLSMLAAASRHVVELAEGRGIKVVTIDASGTVEDSMRQLRSRLLLP